MRLDLFTPIHKGLRRTLFETAIALGRTDFSSVDEIAAAETLVGECLTYLREHAEHEDRHVIPEIARLAPELAATMAEEHPQLERAAIEVDSLWPRFAPLGRDERVAMGGELARRFQALVAMQLRHMDREEREVNAVFWAGMHDGELAALNRRIVVSIPPARLLTWQSQVLLPALSAPERARMAAHQPSPI